VRSDPVLAIFTSVYRKLRKRRFSYSCFVWYTAEATGKNIFGIG